VGVGRFDFFFFPWGVCSTELRLGGAAVDSAEAANRVGAMSDWVRRAVRVAQ